MKKIVLLAVLSLVLFGCATSNRGQYVSYFKPKQNVTLEDFQGTWESGNYTYIFTENRFEQIDRTGNPPHWEISKFSGTFTFDDERITLHIISEERDGVLNPYWLAAYGDTFTLRYEISDNFLFMESEHSFVVRNGGNYIRESYLNLNLPTMFEGTWRLGNYITYTFNGVKFEYSDFSSNRSGYFIFDEETITFFIFFEGSLHQIWSPSKYVITGNTLTIDDRKLLKQ